MGARIGLKRIAASLEGDHTCFVRADANVLCWGNNASGQIGDGTSGNTRLVPTRVTGVIQAIAVAVGRDHSCALLVDGTVRCWGLNNFGQLGVGATPASSSVVVTVPNLSNVVAITAGIAHTCARQSTGTVRCWGLNNFGQIGDGTQVSPRLTPAAVSGINDAVKVVAGASHTCALRGGGGMSCWGGNGQGELGNGATATRQDAPSAVVDLTEVTEIAAGLRFTCAMRANGQVLCWGANDVGQSGNKTREANILRPQPTLQVDANGAFSPAIAIAAGRTHACAAELEPGSHLLKCWGGNAAGQLGIGSTTASEQVPLRVSGPLAPLETAAGRAHTCALAANDAVLCWGSNALGQLGVGGTSPSLVPFGAQGLAGSVSARSLAAGTNHSCAVRADGTAACWGRNDSGAIGDGTFADRLVATRVVNNLNAPLVSIVGGGNHTCAALVGRAFTLCWGDNRSRQVSPASTSDFLPLPVIATLTTQLGGATLAPSNSLAAGSSHGCTASVSASCFGQNDQGQLGDTGASLRFEVGVGSFVNAVSVVTGGAHSCALLGTGRIHCWGLNTLGQLGDGTRTSRSTPQPVTGVVNAVSLSTTRDHTCALLATGNVVCWGRNDFGQVDGRVGGDRLVPTPVATLAAGDAVAVTTGFQHTCILDSRGLVQCWGRNNDGQLGNNTTVDNLTPVPALRQDGASITLLAGISSLVSDAAHNCAIHVSGRVMCWGRNPEGQLGDGTRLPRLAAITVGSFTANIARNAQLSALDRIAQVTALVNCPEGQRFFAEVTVTQERIATGSGHVGGECTGGVSAYPVTVAARGRRGFVAGEAIARAEIIVRDGSEVTDEQEWTRSIELAP